MKVCPITSTVSPNIFYGLSTRRSNGINQKCLRNVPSSVTAHFVCFFSHYKWVPVVLGQIANFSLVLANEQDFLQNRGWLLLLLLLGVLQKSLLTVVPDADVAVGLWTSTRAHEAGCLLIFVRADREPEDSRRCLNSRHFANFAAVVLQAGSSEPHLPLWPSALLRLYPPTPHPSTASFLSPDLPAPCM